MSLDVVAAIAAWSYPAARMILRALGIRASNHPRLAALADAVRDPYERVEAFDCDYAQGPDHWLYTTNPIERERHQVALRLLDSARADTSFGRVFEVACAEGVFTEMIAPLCESLAAVDFSEIALNRARQRCDWGNRVVFRQWNLRTDPIPGPFDVIVVMDVLSTIRRPGRLRKVIEKLVAGLRSGDLLLVGDYREGKLLEDSWLGKRLLFGGKWVVQEVATHPALATVEKASTETHVFALLRRS